MTKVLVSLDEKLLAQVDKVAAAEGLSRSAYLARLIEQELVGLGGPGRSRAVRQALQRIDRLFKRQPGGREATAAVRRSRDFR